MPASSLQRDFLRGMANPYEFCAMFEHLPGVFFFVKDRRHKLIAASTALRERLGLQSEAELIGAGDEDFFPAHIVRGFHEDDDLVFQTGQPLCNRLEVWYDEQHHLDWFLTTKVPLHGRHGKVIGLMGVTRRDEGRAGSETTTEVTRVVSFLQEHTDRIWTVAELADACGISERTLFRKVQQSLGTTPYELMLRVRVQKAAEALLQTNDKIAQIAVAHGFCDQSTFTQHFRKRTGMTPKKFRARHQQ